MIAAVTIVIPNYNGADLLRRNLPTVFSAARAYSADTRIIVVDDGSTDDSVAILKKEFPQALVIEHQQNRGFADAAFSGVMAAETELIFLLNSDVQPDEDCIAPMVRYFSDEATFSVSCLVRDDDGSINRHSWNLRRFYLGDLKAQPWGLEAALQRQQEHHLLTLYATGGSMLLRRSLFLQLGGFCPIFKPFYSEDYDLGLRAWRRGWYSYFEPRSRVLHQSMGSIKSNVRLQYVKQIRRRNKYLLEWIHLPAWRLWTTVIPLQLWRLIGELLILDAVNLKGFVGALGRIPGVLTARAEIKSTQKLEFGAVLDLVNRA